MGKKSKKKASRKGGGIATGGGSGPGKRNQSNHFELFGGEPSSTHHRAAPSSSFQSIYQVYKTATLRFKEQLSILVPSEIFKDNYVQCFLDAADYVKENGIAINSALLRNLRVAISVRKRFARRLVDGGDEGHAYFISVLNYCMQVLKYCAKVEDDVRASSQDKKLGAGEGSDDDDDVREFMNRFDALSMEDNFDGESDSEDEAGDANTLFARPEPPAREFSLDDLMYIPDRAKCMFLFDTMAYHMFRLTHAVTSLKNLVGTCRAESISRHVMITAMVAKYLMLDVERVENELFLECPDLENSPYRVLAVCFFPSYINKASESVRAQSPIARKFRDVDSLAFFGDIIETAFKCNIEEAMPICDRFCKRWKLPEEWKKCFVYCTTVVLRVTMINIRTDSENSQGNPVEFESELFSEDVNLDWMSFEDIWKPISGDRSILNTMRLLDMAGSWDRNNDDHLFPKVFAYLLKTSSKWGDADYHASKIRGDMDSLLLKFTFCFQYTHWNCEVARFPGESDMLPVLACVRDWTAGRSGRKATSYAMTFTMHCILVFLFEFQGEGCLDRITNAAKEGFDRFMTQAEEQFTLDVPCPKTKENRLKKILQMRMITELYKQLPRGDNEFRSMKDLELLFWNPICAGQILGYSNIYLSLRAGIATIESSSDVTAVLHLFNALKQRSLVKDDLPLLSDIDRYFATQKSVWNGWDKPSQGKFVYQFHLSLGMPNQVALYEQERRKHKILGLGQPPLPPNLSYSRLRNNMDNSKRVSASIEPDEISETYKRNCLSIFDDVEEALKSDHDVPEHININPSSPIPLAFQVSNAKIYLLVKSFAHGMFNELKYNLVSVGIIFSQFMYETFNRSNNDEVEMVEARYKDIKHEGTVRTYVNMDMAVENLAQLDYVKDDETFEYLWAAFEKFFSNLDLNRVLLYK